MTRLLSVLALVAAVGASWGQDVQTEKNKVTFESGTSEVDRAMAAFSTRLEAQTDAWFEDGDYWLCIQILEMQVEWYPASYELVTNLGWMYGNIEDKPRSLEVYEAFRKRYPDNPEAAYPVAQFYYFAREYDKVIPVLEPTLTMKPSPHANTYRILAQAYRRTGRLKDALRVLDLLIALDPNDLAAKRNRDSIAEELKGGG